MVPSAVFILTVAYQIFPFQKFFEKSWEYAKDVYPCFANIVKEYHWVPRKKLCGMLRECNVDAAC